MVLTISIILMAKNYWRMQTTLTVTSAYRSLLDDPEGVEDENVKYEIMPE